jgi:hypothetical protein
MKRKISIGILLLSLSFLFIVSILEQELSVEFMKLVIETTGLILWVIIPSVIGIGSLLVVGLRKEKFTLMVQVITSLLLISNMTFLFLLNLHLSIGFEVLFIALSVWGSLFWFIVALLTKLLYSYFFTKNIKEVIEYMLKAKIVKSFLLSATVTFVLLQLFLMGSAIEAYKAVKVSKIKEKAEYSLFYFYRPLISEIRLSDGKRWAYSRVKFVDNGR